MKPEQRQDQILARLRAFQSEVSVEELASLFGVSALTIRRDLDQLDAQGAIVRTHGGCMLKSSIESAYRRRVATNFELKQAIGRAAADELQAAGTVLINDGSTTFHLAAHLGGRGSFTVFTNSIAIMTELSRFPEIRLYLLGGELDRQMNLLGGDLTEQILEMFYVDLAFLGADAIDAKGWCLVPTTTEARLTQIMLRRSKRRILLADHTKCESDSHAAFARLEDFDLWITTPGINPERRSFFQQAVKIKEVTP